MANPPTGHSTANLERANQESMFDETTDSARLEAYESDFEAEEEASYESAEDISEDAHDPFIAEEDLHTVTETTEYITTGSVKTSEDNSVLHPESGQQSLLQDSHAEPASDTLIEQEAPTVLTADDFSALEDRIIRAVSLVRREREARIAAEERTAALETEIQKQAPVIKRLQGELDTLRVERDQVRQRVERLLGQLDALEL